MLFARPDRELLKHWHWAFLTWGGLGRLHFNCFGRNFKLLAELKWKVKYCVLPMLLHVSLRTEILNKKNLPRRQIRQVTKKLLCEHDSSWVGRWIMEKSQIFMKHTQFSKGIIFIQTTSTLYLHFIKNLMGSLEFFKLCLIIFITKPNFWASLVAQWLRICLPMQGTRVRALVWEDPTCHGAAGSMSHNYWACASGACAPQQERPQWEARAPQWGVTPACRN